MVSVDVKAVYWQSLRAVPHVSFFLDFLDVGPVRPALPPDPAEAGSMVEHLLTCIRDNDRDTATDLYNKLSARRLHAESELVHDDFLVFAAVCTVRKFQFNDQWVRNILRLRPTHEQHKQMLVRSFDNLLAGDCNVREDYHQVSVVFQLVVGQHQPDAVRLHKMVAFLWRNPFPWFDSEFLTIISMRAIRAAFEAKGLLSPEQRFETEEFAGRFCARTKRISNAAAWVVFSSVVALLIVLNLRYAENAVVKIVLGVGAVLTLIGSLTDLRKLVAAWTEQAVKKTFGYRFGTDLSSRK